MMADTSTRTLEDSWLNALSLSEDGRVHEAVFEFERVYATLKQQLGIAQTVASAGRVRSLLVELLKQLDEEVEAHLSYLRGNLFAALEVDPSVDATEIKKAYRKLALRYHPDKSRLSPKLFNIVKHSYETLSDPSKRKCYTPSKSAQEWASWRQRHSAKMRAELRCGIAADESDEAENRAEPHQSRPTELPSTEAVSAMSISQLKAQLNRFKVLMPKGHLERADLEKALHAAICEQQRAFASQSHYHKTIADQLHAASNVDRRKLAAKLSTECLRSLLENIGQAPPKFFGRASLVAAVVEAYKRQVRSQDTQAPCTRSPARGFVQQFRSQMYRSDSHASAFQTTTVDDSADKVQANNDIVGDGTDAASSADTVIDHIQSRNLFSKREAPAPDHYQKTAEPIVAGGWFWGVGERL